jgi:uncharacterized protein YbjT (DUF2867 family)
MMAGVSQVQKRTALIAGATGLVGGHCLRRLLASDVFGMVVALGRRPALVEHDHLRNLIVDFGRLDEVPPLPADVAFSALGTTLAKAGSKEAFRAVDHDAVVAFARWARAGGARTFVLVSAAGAAPHARAFYLRVKGETEQAVQALGYQRLVVLRPGLLLGARNERRPAEALARAIVPVLNPLLQGSLRSLRGIPADTVAAAMVAAGGTDEPGQLVWTYDQIISAASQ